MTAQEVVSLSRFDRFLESRRAEATRLKLGRSERLKIMSRKPKAGMNVRVQVAGDNPERLCVEREEVSQAQ